MSTPEQIAAKLESTADGRLVRAWLLRVVDGDSMIHMPRWRDAEEIAEAIGLRPDRAVFNLGVATRGEFPAMLTELGKLVAQACRPKPWRAFEDYKPGRPAAANEWCVAQDSGTRAQFIVARCGHKQHAERIATLLTAADLAAAKEPK